MTSKSQVRCMLCIHMEVPSAERAIGDVGVGSCHFRIEPFICKKSLDSPKFCRFCLGVSSKLKTKLAHP